jgi:hypothetical protein
MYEGQVNLADTLGFGRSISAIYDYCFIGYLSRQDSDRHMLYSDYTAEGKGLFFNKHKLKYAGVYQNG